MKIVVRVVVGLLLLLFMAVTGVYVWASSTSSRILAGSYEAHEVSFPIPYPLSDDEIAEFGTVPADREHVALERAVERGRHLVSSRYMCTDCHGEDFSGGTMVDAFPIGTLLGPNLTLGAGSRTAAYTAAQWDRIVRHGILPDGRPSVMPSEDFRLMSDQELSDIVAYIRSFPSVDNVVQAPTLGPLGKLLLATGQLPLSAQLIEAHDSPHRTVPPPTEVTVEFGEHLAATCMGCHGSDMAGGKIAGGDPSWPPARNLTPHATGTGGWSYADFVAALRQGVRPDGTQLQVPMTFVTPYAQRMSDVELEAIWVYLQSLPAIATGD